MKGDLPMLMAAPVRRFVAPLLLLQGAIVALLGALVWHAARPGFLDAWATAEVVGEDEHGLRGLARAVTLLGGPPFVAVAAAGLAVWAWWRWRDLLTSAFFVAAPGLGGVAELALKPIVGRSRPPAAALIGEHGWSFPSGHVTGVAALAVVSLIALFSLTSRWQVRGAAALVVVADHPQRAPRHPQRPDRQEVAGIGCGTSHGTRRPAPFRQMTCPAPSSLSASRRTRPHNIGVDGVRRRGLGRWKRKRAGQERGTRSK